MAELVAPDGEEELALDPPEPLAPVSLEAALPPVLPPVLPPLVPPPEEAELEGALPDGEVLEPAPADPLFIVAEPETDEPEPEGEDGEALDDGALLEDDEALPDGEDGAVLEPDADEELPDGEVVVPRDADVLSARSHAVRRLAPKATDTASASVESFMGPP